MKVQQRLLAFQETVKVDDVTKKTGLVFSGDVGFFVGLGFFCITIKLGNIKGITNTRTYPPFLCS